MIPPEVVSKMFGPCALCAPARPLRLSAYSARVVRVEMLSLTSPKFREGFRRRVSKMIAVNVERCRGREREGGR
jgi:hypothetical protein